jgi:hypothetical protein
MADDFSRYLAMRGAGAGPEVVYRSARTDGLDRITIIRLLRRVFNMSLAEAKEVGIVADGLAASLEEYQERFIEPLSEALGLCDESHSEAAEEE